MRGKEGRRIKDREWRRENSDERDRREEGIKLRKKEDREG